MVWPSLGQGLYRRSRRPDRSPHRPQLPATCCQALSSRLTLTGCGVRSSCAKKADAQFLQQPAVFVQPRVLERPSARPRGAASAVPAGAVRPGAGHRAPGRRAACPGAARWPSGSAGRCCSAAQSVCARKRLGTGAAVAPRCRRPRPWAAVLSLSLRCAAAIPVSTVAARRATSAAIRFSRACGLRRCGRLEAAGVGGQRVGQEGAVQRHVDDLARSSSSVPSAHVGRRPSSAGRGCSFPGTSAAP